MFFNREEKGLLHDFATSDKFETIAWFKDRLEYTHGAENARTQRLIEKLRSMKEQDYYKMYYSIEESWRRPL